MVAGGVALFFSGDIGGFLFGGVVAAGGLAIVVAGIAQFAPGFAIREQAKQLLKDLGLDPKIKRKKALSLVSFSPVIHRDMKGLRLAMQF